MKRPALAAVGALALLSAMPRDAAAFCGFYVSGADTRLLNKATQVVLMREGTRTVLSMQNSYQGPPENFAMVVPVPVILQQENVKTLSREVFDRADKMSAPRLVEYWEQDPCAGLGLGSIGTIGFGAGQGFGSGRGRLGGEHVVVHAEFVVGEYEVVILGADDALALDGWLRDHHYKIPDGAEPLLRPYVQAGSKFFVAKVDVSKVRFENGRAALSPLRFHYDSEKFELPIRLGLINSDDKQDLIVNILGRHQRYEVANYPNTTIPTNLDVAEDTRDAFGAFYAALFDRTLEAHPGAVVTEYAWDATTCDPCPGPTLTSGDLAALGADALPTDGPPRGPSQLRISRDKIEGRLPPEVIERVVRQSFGRLRACYDEARARTPALKGKVIASFDIKQDGGVGAVGTESTELTDEGVQTCVNKAIKQLSFPQPEGGTVKARINLDFSVRPSAGSTYGFVLTRLHARYDKKSLGEDLVFKPAPPIVGGREQRNADRQLEQGAQPAERNNFQARYAMRHPWQGPISCDKPIKGIWGGPPAGSASPPTRPATDLAFAPRGTPVERFLDKASLPLVPSALPPPPPAPDASASPSPAPPSKKACGCEAPGKPAVSAPYLLLPLLFALARRRITAASRRT